MMSQRRRRGGYQSNECSNQNMQDSNFQQPPQPTAAPMLHMSGRGRGRGRGGGGGRGRGRGGHQSNGYSQRNLQYPTWQPAPSTASIPASPAPPSATNIPASRLAPNTWASIVAVPKPTLGEAGLSVAMSKLNINQRPSQTVPLTSFGLFPELPAELRTQIWGHVANQTRILEVVHSRVVDEDNDHDHDHAYIAKQCRRVPGILQANCESRDEAKKSYKIVMFDFNLDDEPRRKAIYYNPNVDIVFFGEAACSVSMSLFFKYGDTAIPRVAVLMSGGMTILGSTLLDILYGGGIRKGCQGLKEVFFVMESNLWVVDKGKVPTTAVLRPAVTEGITKGQHRTSQLLKDRIALIEAEGDPYAVEQGWVGDKIPKFRFMSLSDPREVTSTSSCDAIPVAHSKARKLGWDNGKRAVQKLQRSTGCKITVADRKFPGQEPREIGFVGTRDAIEKAKAGILHFLDPNPELEGHAVRSRGMKHNYKTR